MKILFFSTYYYPYISGITTYPKLLFGKLSHTHQITILTFPHLPTLRKAESIEYTQVIRIPYLLRISKGFISPQSIVYFWQYIKRNDTVFLNIPNFEGWLLALFAKFQRKPIIAIYHCQVFLGSSIIEKISSWFLNQSVTFQLNLSRKVIIYTQDYFTSLPANQRYKAKTIQIYPPTPVLPVNIHTRSKFETMKQENIWIGYAGRIAREKGLEYVIEAINMIESDFPHLQLVIAGPSGNEVVGEGVYTKQLIQKAKQSDVEITFLGTLQEDELGAFYKTIDLLVLPSINQTEAFGMVQVEAMMLGTPVIASDLPGVRVPIQETGMGLLCPPRNTSQLASALKEILSHKSKYTNNQKTRSAREIFNYHHTFASYEKLFQEL